MENRILNKKKIMKVQKIKYMIVYKNIQKVINKSNNKNMQQEKTIQLRNKKNIITLIIH